MAVKTANVSVRVEPSIKEEMDDATFNAIMQRGLDEAKAGKGHPASEVIASLRKGI